MGKAVVLIDGGYLNSILEKIFSRSPLSYEKFSDRLCSDADCERHWTLYYSCAPYQSSPPTPDEITKLNNYEKFVTYLEKLPRFSVKSGWLWKIGNEFRQRGVDVHLAVDLVRLACRKVIDKAILVAGYIDLVPAVEAAREEGVETILYYSSVPPIYVSQKLLQYCAEKHEIDHDLIDASRA